ncbi:isatin hydrolase-like [Saccostrea cucullata]|uniref:isatin hydrolase-like n=1 Tax=Saccostrea cuccullata TaxID=36930 RepID=UPI002ED1BE75
MDTVLYFSVLLLTAVRPMYSAPRIVDLSHQQDDNAVSWPVNPPYNFTKLHRGFYAPFNIWLENNHIAMPEHMGTHVDAPVHTFKGTWRTHQIPIEKLYGPGVIINVKAKVESNPDYRVSTDDLLKYEEKYGEIPRHSVVIMNSGWTQKYLNNTLVWGTMQLLDSSTFHFPSWHEEAVTWLINKRQVNAIGVDTPSTDYGQSKTLPCHLIMGKNNVVGIENVANLDNIPESGSTIYVPVIKIYDGSGGPARLFGTYDDDPDKTNAASTATSSMFYTCFFIIPLIIKF